MKDASAESRKNKSDAETILSQVQHKVQKHDMTVRFWSFCHPEPGFGISVFGFRIWFFKTLPYGRGSLLSHWIRNVD
jgi:hypothetical protein